MSHFHSNALLGASGNQGYEIERSLRFNSADSAFLHRTPSGAGNQKKYTISLWVKRTAFLASALDVSFLGAGDGTTYGISGTGAFGASLNGHVFMRNGGANLGYWDIEFRDPSAWYHFVLAIDTDQSTAANRNRLYVNGVDQGAPSANFGSGASTSINAASIHSIGTFNLPSSLSPFAGYFTNGYLAEYNFVDGSQLGPGSFGETDPVTGAWIPKKYVGTYGTNGFYLDFSDNSGVTATTLGKDSSGNSNNWTPNNFSVTAGAGNDSLEDTPTNNFCTMNPLDTDPARTSTVAISNGNLDASVSTYSTVQYVMRTATFASIGKDYFEVRKGDSTNKRVYIGFLEENGARSGPGNGGIPIDFYGYGSGDTASANTGLMVNDGTFSATGLPAVDPGTLGDIIMVCHDRDNKKIWFGKNGTWFTTGGVVGDPAAGTAPAITYTTDKELIPCIGAGSFANTTVRNVNFGQRPFDYTPPTGFKALNTANLPVPTVKDGTEYFDSKLWTGNGTSQTISGLSFQPDWAWLKARSIAYQHSVYDAVRGTSAGRLATDQTLAQVDNGAGNPSFTSDGITVKTVLNDNASGQTFVGWFWKAGGTTTTPTQGTIASTASVNTEAGFSIVEYTGNSTAGATVGHGLGVAPKMIITKTSNTNLGNWGVYHYGVDTTSPEDYMLNLNLTNARTNSALWWNDTAPTSTVFTVGTSNDVNGSSNYIAYCFAEVEGFSKFGSYTGNAVSGDGGPFVQLNFAPAWVLIKSSTVATSWYLFDSIRGSIQTEGSDAQVLFPDTGAIEDANGGQGIDFLSNGFKVRSANGYGLNNSATYIFMAFAERPFKYANAR